MHTQSNSRAQALTIRYTLLLLVMMIVKNSTEVGSLEGEGRIKNWVGKISLERSEYKHESCLWDVLCVATEDILFVY